MKFIAYLIAALWLSAAWCPAVVIINSFTFSAGGSPPPPGDPYFASVVMLLHMDGSNNSTTFTDSSSGGKTVTAVNGAKLTTTGAKYGSACGTFAAAGLDYLQLADSADWHFGSGDFTIELWAYPLSATASGTVIAQWGASSNSWFFGVGTGYGFYLSTNGSSSVLALPLSRWPGGANAWQHVAICRSGASLRLFVNGVQQGSTYNISTSTLHDSSNALRVAVDNAGNPLFNGRLDDLRITKGVARYTADFTPPTSAHPDA